MLLKTCISMSVAAMIDVNSNWDSASCHLFFLSLSICRRFFSPTLLTLFWNNIFPRGRFSPVDHHQIAQILEYYNSFFFPLTSHSTIMYCLNHFIQRHKRLPWTVLLFICWRFPVFLFISFPYRLSLFDGTFTTNPAMLLNFPVDLQDHFCKIIINTL